MHKGRELSPAGGMGERVGRAGVGWRGAGGGRRVAISAPDLSVM